MKLEIWLCGNGKWRISRKILCFWITVKYETFGEIQILESYSNNFIRRVKDLITKGIVPFKFRTVYFGKVPFMDYGLFDNWFGEYEE